MPAVTFPHQRTIHVHRERATSDFLGIKNENWQAAARDLGAHSMMLYLYLACNADNFTLALSPTAIRQAIGMARSTYHDQFNRLLDKGYLVQSTGNTFEFYEKPQFEHTLKNSVSADELNFAECSSDDKQADRAVQVISAQDIEINNNTPSTNKSGTNITREEVEKYIPKAVEINIPVPKAEGKNRPKYTPRQAHKAKDPEDFIF